MKLPEVFKLKFDPDLSEIPALKTRIGLILWSCIKTGHITDQYFDDNVKKVADRIEKKQPETYSQFKEIIRKSPLSIFGRVTVDERQFGYHTEIDHEFWGQVWKYLTGRQKQKIEIVETNP